MLLSLLLGFGVGMVLLSPMHFERYFTSQHPAMDMPIVPERALSSLGVVTRTAPLRLRGFANRQGRFVSPFKPMTALANGAGHGSSRSQVVRASEKPRFHLRAPCAVQQFQSALEFAEDCIGECLREWHEAEDLAAQVAYKEAGQLSQEDVDHMKVTLQKIVAARMELKKEAGTVNVQMLKDTAEEMKDFSKKLPTFSLQR